jgi:lipid-A-disaccharide synthase
MLVAGEPSGDALGGQLMRRLAELTSGNVKFIGVGGCEMRSAGLQSLFPMADISVMGIRDVLPRLPRLHQRMAQTANFAMSIRPDVAVLIDSSDFMRGVASRIKQGTPAQRIVKFVSPQVWASRPGRARVMARHFDHMLCLFPFEVPFFRQVGLPATFVGHPVIERLPAPGQGQALRQKLGLNSDDRIIVLLPGSRSGEVRVLLPLFAEALRSVIQSVGPVTILLPTVATVREQVREQIIQLNLPVRLIDDQSEKWAAFEAANVALAASGTVALELALAGTPMVVGYRVGWLTAAIARRLISVKYFTLINLILNRRAIPELIQEDCTAENLSRELISLLTNPAERARQVTDAAEAMRLLGQGSDQPSLRAARAVLDIADQTY